MIEIRICHLPLFPSAVAVPEAVLAIGVIIPLAGADNEQANLGALGIVVAGLIPVVVLSRVITATRQTQTV